jgi:biotin transport system substrate-specific component
MREKLLNFFKSRKGNRMKGRDLTLTALLAAMLCAAAPWSVPVGPVPVSPATFAVYLAGASAGWKRGGLAVLVYVLLGCAGVPVFSGFSGGVQKLFGVTGGFILGYIPCALLAGLAADKFPGKRWAAPAGMVLGTLVLYTVGTAWFMLQTKNPLSAALLTCVVPFLAFDAGKIVLASLLAPKLRKLIDSPRQGG